MNNQNYKHSKALFNYLAENLNADFSTHTIKLENLDSDPTNAYDFNVLCDGWQLLTPREQRLLGKQPLPDNNNVPTDELYLIINICTTRIKDMDAIR